MIHWKSEGRGQKGNRTHGFKNKTLVPVEWASAHSWLHSQHLHLQLLTVKVAALPGREPVRVDCHVPRHLPIASGQPHLSDVFVLVTPQLSYQVPLSFLGSSETLQASSQLSSIITLFIMVKIGLFSSRKHCLCVSVHVTNNRISFYCAPHLYSCTATEAPASWVIYKSCVALACPIQQESITQPFS